MNKVDDYDHLNDDDGNIVVEKLTSSPDQHSSSSECSSQQDDTESNPGDSLKDQQEQKQQQQQQQTVIEVVCKEETIQIFTQFASHCKSKLNFYADKNGPSIIINVPEIYEIYRLLKGQSVEIKVITEVTTHNLRYCKQIITEFGAEVRHIENIQGTFGVADEKVYVASSVLEDSKSLNEVIYSDVKGIVQQNQFIFDTLWNKAKPSEQRIREIEEGLLPPITKILDKPEDISTYVLDLLETTKVGVSACSLVTAFEVMDNYKPVLESYKNLIKRHKAGEIQNGVRFLTHIENNNQKQVDLIKKFLKIGFSIRHTSNLPSLSFIVSEKQLESTIETMKGGQIATSLLYSTEPLYIQHYQSLFEELWNSSIDAEERIRQIEGGISTENTKIIENPVQIKRYLIDLVKDAKEEIMIVFSSSNAVRRQANMGIIDLLKQKAAAENIKIKILSPTCKNNKELLLLQYFYDKNSINENIIVKEIANQSSLKSSIVLVDQKYVLAIELKDDSKESFEEAIGLATYSTNKPTLLSYTSIFEGLWNQTAISDSLSMANEKLVESEQLEKEFINTAAHELRTPTQAITGYLELDDELFDDLFANGKNMSTKDLEAVLITLRNHHKIISRNTARLENLINNLLDVARIESKGKNNPISLDKERFDVVKEIKGLIKYQLNQKIKDKNIRVNFANEMFDELCLVYADRSRVNQIITNLLDNAIKFSKTDSTIDIMLYGNKENISEKSKEKQKFTDQNQHQLDTEMIYIAISDSGKGISPDILPRLFEKFMTNSDTGTGLGLYISKKLVEAMGGKIWAFNNDDGVGSTFVFSLPKTDDTNI